MGSVLGHLYGEQGALAGLGDGDHPAFEGNGAAGGEVIFDFVCNLFCLVFILVESCGDEVVELAFAVFGGGGCPVVGADLANSLDVADRGQEFWGIEGGKRGAVRRAKGCHSGDAAGDR